jgi:hypothetical protein
MQSGMDIAWREGYTGGAAITCNSQNTKLPELSFHVILGDGAREVRFEHLAVR